MDISMHKMMSTEVGRRRFTHKRFQNGPHGCAEDRKRTGTLEKDNAYHFNGYSINGNAIDEGFGIDKSDGLFIWYYTERGQKDNQKYFRTENEAVAFAFNQIKADKWTKAQLYRLFGRHKEDG